MRATPREVEDFVVYQIGALAAIAAAAGRAPPAREAARRAVQHGGRVTRPLRTPSHAQPPSVDRSLILFGLPGSELIAAGTASRLAYRVARRLPTAPIRPDGTLVPRSEPGAVIEDQESVVNRAVSHGARSRGQRDRRLARRSRGGNDLRARRHAGRGSARVAHSEGADRCRRQRSACRCRERRQLELMVSATSTRRSTFPTIVFGSSVRNSTCAGTLYGASRSRQYARSSSSVALSLGLQHDPRLGHLALDGVGHAGDADLHAPPDARRSPLRSRAATPGSRSSSSCPSCDRRGRRSRRRPCRRGRRCAATARRRRACRSVSAVSSGLFQYSEHVLRRAHDHLADLAGRHVAARRFSASTMRTSTSGSGRPIDPILFVPCTGLTQHAIIAFGQRVALDDARAGLLLELPLGFGHQRGGAARSTT